MHCNDDAALTKREFESLSEFLFQLRHFERFSEDTVRAHGITPQQYLLLLHIKGFPRCDYATTGRLAERLQIKPGDVTALIASCENLDLLEQRQSSIDQYQIEIRLLDEGERLLTRLACLHCTALQSWHGDFVIPFLHYPA